jgi:crotonobetainyl-CoA:carnitine CoA-transferase CaiB-like acyl-CoA transferase
MFSELIGKPDLLDTDPRFRNQETRTQHAEEMGKFLAEHLPMKTTQEWLDSLRQVDIPASRVNSIDDLFHDPHLKAVDFFNDMKHPTEGMLKVARFPVAFSKTPASVRRLAPNLGQHTDEVIGAVQKAVSRGKPLRNSKD